MPDEVAILIGPCPVCGQRAITLFSDGRCKCFGVTMRAIFKRRPEVWEVAAPLSSPGTLAGIARIPCGYEATAAQCAHDILHPYA